MAEDDGIASCEEQIRTCIPVNYSYLFEGSACKFHSKENFAATFRIKEVTNKEHAKKWLEELSQHSYVTWRCQVQPRCRMKNAFKSYLKCQHKSSSKPLKRSRVSKDTNCEATLTLIVRRTDYDRVSRSTNPDPLLMDWPCIVVLSNIHNHKLDSADILRFRHMSVNTQTRLLDMFRLGHSPSSAFHTLETELCLENPESCHDGAYLPTVGRLTHFFNPKFKAHFKSKSAQDIMLESQKLLVHWGQTTGGKYVIGTTNDNNQYYVALCTPLMGRVHEMVTQSSDIVYLEAVGGQDRQRHRVYFLVVATAAGGLPLGVIISNSKMEEILTSALSDLQSVCFPPGAFNFSGSPKVIVSDRLQELNILQHHFPFSTILVSSYHVLQDAWCWLSDTSRNKVAEAERHILYRLLKAVVRCDSEEQLNASYQELLDHHLCGTHHTFKAYVMRLWESRQEWAHCYQPDIPVAGFNLANCCSVAFRILRDVLFLRVMAFRLTPLLDFVINQYERYVEKTMLLYATRQYSNCLLEMFLPCIKDVKIQDICPHPAVEGHFLVPCDGAEDTMQYQVDACDMTCSCQGGCGTNLCKHASSVLQKLVVESTLFCNPGTVIEEDVAIAVAMGDACGKNTVPVINENVEHEENDPSLQLASVDGVEVESLPEPGQSIAASSFVLDNLTLVPESTASIIQYAISNDLFGEDVVYELATGDTVSCNFPMGEAVSFDVPMGESTSHQVPVIGNCVDTTTESTYTFTLTAAPLSTSQYTENSTQSDKANASVYLMEALSDNQTLTHLPITDSVMLNRFVDQLIQNPEILSDATLLVDSEGMQNSVVHGTVNMPTVNLLGPNVETVEMPPDIPEYSNSTVTEVSRVVISSQNNHENNNPEECELMSDTEEKFDSLVERIKECKKTNPAIFKIAIRKMVANAKSYAETDKELASALASFAKPSRTSRNHKEREKRMGNLV